MATFFAEHWVVISFYALVLTMLVLFRKRFEWQGRVVGLLRTNWGVEWMTRTGKRHKKLIQRLGYVGIFVGFLGMITIVGFLVYGAFQLFLNPAAPPVISPVLPGIQVPGSPIAFPLFQTLIALFFVILVHEAAHGLVAAAHGLKVKSSGLLVFGPIFGAFVEPEEENVTKKPHKVQHSIFAAGPFSNVLLAILMIGLWIGGMSLIGSQVDALGVTFDSTLAQSPADLAGLPPGTLLTRADGQPMQDTSVLFAVLQNKTPGDTLTLGTADREYAVTLAAHPDDPERPWVGIEGVETVFDAEQSSPVLFAIIMFIMSVLYWTYVLSLGLGLANLLPLGPVDGGRMLQLVLHRMFGQERGDQVWAKSSILVLLIVLILLVVPILRAVFFTGAVA